MGGTFDPVHMVHLMLAENAYRDYCLDSVLMVPGGSPPHKKDRTVTPAKDRLAMLELAVDGIPYMKVSDMEIRRGGYSYSSVTLAALREAHPDTDYYFIMGADSVYQIETWHEPASVMSSCIILAAVRGHTPQERLKARIGYLAGKYGADIRILEIPDTDISSTGIRERVAEGRSIRFMVPDPVIAYIENTGLYRRE